MQHPSSRIHSTRLKSYSTVPVSIDQYSLKGLVNLFEGKGEQESPSATLEGALDRGLPMPPSEAIQLLELPSCGYFDNESRTISQRDVIFGFVCVTTTCRISPDKSARITYVFALLVPISVCDQESSDKGLFWRKSEHYPPTSSITPILGVLRETLGLICLVAIVVDHSLHNYVCLTNLERYLNDQNGACRNG